MSSFNDVTKYLDLVPARKASLAEAQQAPTPFDKYYNVIPSRRIGKVNQYIRIPEIILPCDLFGLQARIDYNLPNSFHLMPFYGQLAGLSRSIFAAISYKNTDNGLVYRYILTWYLTQEFWWSVLKTNPISEKYVDACEVYKGLIAPFYQGEKIGKDFSIEFYSVGIFLSNQQNFPETKFKISLFQNPATASDTEGQTYDGIVYTRNDLITPFPEIYTSDIPILVDPQGNIITEPGGNQIVEP